MECLWGPGIWGGLWGLCALEVAWEGVEHLHVLINTLQVSSAVLGLFYC